MEARETLPKVSRSPFYALVHEVVAVALTNAHTIEADGVQLPGLEEDQQVLSYVLDCLAEPGSRTALFIDIDAAASLLSRLDRYNKDGSEVIRKYAHDKVF